MSISNIIPLIETRCKEGLLFPINPPINSDRIVRHLYVTADIKQNLDKHADASTSWGTTKGIMDSFVSGNLISVGNKKRSMMALLDKKVEGVWEMRATRPRPSIRILGQFVEFDFFICLVWEPRKNLEGGNSQTWKNFITNCKTEWRNLFFPYTPLQKDDENEYLSHIFPN